MEIQCKLCSKKKDEFQKVMSLAILGGLPTASHSLALSHYWPTQRLLAAGFPLWPIPPRLRQPDPPWLPREVHVDAGLSADTGSTWTDSWQESIPQAIPQNLPPSSWITGARHNSQQYTEWQVADYTNINSDIYTVRESCYWTRERKYLPIEQFSKGGSKCYGYIFFPGSILAFVEYSIHFKTEHILM